MSYLLIALSVCLAAQAPGSSNEVQPIKPGHRAAPPAAWSDTGRAATPARPAAPHYQPDLGSPDLQPDEAPPPVVQRNDPYRDDPTAGEVSEPMQTLGAQPRQRLRPPELIAEALENPKQAALTGTPLTLAQALAKISDRNQQLATTKTYWRLAAAQASYHWALEQRDLLRDQTRSHTNQPATLGARAAARADVRDAQLAVEQAQAELTNLMGASADRSTPLANDRPHVGDYTTNYQDIFGNRAAPPRLRLVNRTLPLRRKAIDAHAEAIVAALDAVEATGEQFRTSGQGLSTLLDVIENLKQQRQAFIDEVRDYNLDIAEYAFAVAPAGVASQTMVSMLIRTSPSATTAGPNRATDPNSPALRKTFRRNVPDAGDGAQHSPEDPDQWTVHYAHAQDFGAAAGDDRGWYEGLLDVASAPIRVQKLGNLLHWDRNLATDAGRPMALAECLREAPVQNRLAVIDAFWRTREKAALLQLHQDQLDQLNSLQSIAVPQPGFPFTAEAGVRLQAVRRATRATILDAQIEFLSAQADLMQTLGRPLEGVWVLPATPPQAGRYLVSIRARRGYSRGAKWAERMALEYDKLQHRADAVMQCDAHRSELLRVARQNNAVHDTADARMTPLDRVLWAVSRQNQQTRGFLHDLTEYNRAIANYALLTLPENVSGDQLAGKLAINRSTVRDS